MGEIIVGAIILGIIAGICYGIYLLCALVWNTSVCYIGWMDTSFSIALIIAILAFVVGLIILVIGLIGDYDGCKFTAAKIFAPVIIIAGTLSGLIAAYGMVEFSLYSMLDVDMMEYILDRELIFTPMGTIGQIFGSVIFIGIALSALSLMICVLWNIFSIDIDYGDFDFCWEPIVGLFIPSLILGGGLFGWAYVTVVYVWDYPLFEAIIHGTAVAAAFLGVVAALSCLLWKGADWGIAGDYGGGMAGFCLGLAASISVVAYFVYGVKILIGLMSEYYLWIILGFVGLYLILGVVYCLTRLHKIKGFISDGVYKYWHK